jgi:hypothetical protein
MRRPRIRIRTLMFLIAVAAIPAWLARSRDGRTSLIVAGLVAAGLLVAAGIAAVMDRVAGIHSKQERRN